MFVEGKREREIVSCNIQSSIPMNFTYKVDNTIKRFIFNNRGEEIFYGSVHL